MKIHFTFIVLMCCLVTSVDAELLNVKDSIGIEEINGRTFILHKVEAKETFYALSKRYNVSVEDIKEFNPEAESGLKVETILKIPFTKPGKMQSAQNTHTVAPGQTLYSISQIYGIAVEDIKKWNNLNSNDLNVGQKLVMSASDGKSVNTKSTNTTASGNPDNSAISNDPQNPSSKVVHKVEPSQTLFSISKLYNVAVEDIKKWNNLEGNTLDVGQQLTIRVKRESNKFEEAEQIPVITEEVAQEKVVRLDNKVEPELNTAAETEKPAPTETKNSNSSGFKKIVELGLAEIIDDTSDTKKYVALHRTAPIGTIMQVTNEMNNQNVFVRVIGKLPDTGANDKVLIKLSRPAFERLGAVNDKFPAEISYVP